MSDIATKVEWIISVELPPGQQLEMGADYVASHILMAATEVIRLYTTGPETPDIAIKGKVVVA